MTVRRATPDDLAAVLPLMAAFNLEDGIGVMPDASAVSVLLSDAALGFVLVVGSMPPRGYAVVTFNYDLEFAGRDAFVTELYVEPAARRQGLARTLLRAVERHAAVCQVKALHLLVRPDNASAKRLYRAVGFMPVPREMMTKPLT